MSRFLHLASRALRVLLQQNCDWPIIVNLDEHVRAQLGFLQRTPRGRVITALGREHIGAPEARDGLF